MIYIYDIYIYIYIIYIYISNIKYIYNIYILNISTYTHLFNNFYTKTTRQVFRSMAPATSNGWATPTGAWAGWGARSSSNVQSRRSPWRITTCLGPWRSSEFSSEFAKWFLMVISEDFMEKSGLLFPITHVRLVLNGQLYYNAPWKGVTGIPHGFTLWRVDEHTDLWFVDGVLIVY